MRKLRIRRPSPALAISCLALGVALSGTSYATVLNVPRNSVGTPQLKRGAVGTQQLKRNAVKAAKIAPNSIRTKQVVDGSLLSADFKPGQIPQGPKGDKGDKGEKGDPGATNVVVRWSATLTTAGSGLAGRIANCNQGEVAVGGGGGLTGNTSATSGINLLDSKPVPNAAGGSPTGWFAGFSFTAAGFEVAAYAICARP